MLQGHCPQTGTGSRGGGGGGDAPDREGCCCGAGCALLDGQLGAAEGCRGSGRGGEGLRALLGLPEHRARGPHQPPGQCAAPEAPTWPGLHAAERGGHGGLLLLGAGWSVAGAAPGAAGGCAGNHNASSRARWWRGRAGMRPPAACAQLAQPAQGHGELARKHGHPIASLQDSHQPAAMAQAVALQAAVVPSSRCGTVSATGALPTRSAYDATGSDRAAARSPPGRPGPLRQQWRRCGQRALRPGRRLCAQVRAHAHAAVGNAWCKGWPAAAARVRRPAERCRRCC